VDLVTGGSFIGENLEKPENWAIAPPEVEQEWSRSVPGQSCPLFLWKLVLAGRPSALLRGAVGLLRGCQA